jgi:hypothetical protein
MAQKRTHHVNPPGQKSQWHIINPDIDRPTEDAIIRDERETKPLDKHDAWWIRNTLQHGDIDDATRVRLESLLAEIDSADTEVGT